jgi:spore coat protein U-like protein
MKKGDQMMKRVSLFLIFCFGLALPAISGAASVTSPLQVSSQVVSICSVTTTPLAFGAMAPGDTAVQTVAVVTKCTLNTPYQLMLDIGLHGNLGVRNMADAGTNLIPYRLYKDTAQGVEWLDGAAGATNATGSGVDQPHTVHGVATPSTMVPAGVYADTVTVTVLY